MPRATIWRVGQWLLGGLVVALAVRSVVRNWADLQAQEIDWVVRPTWIALAVVTMLGSYVLQIESWRRVVASLGTRLSWKQAAKVCTVSNLGKYVPGKVWAIAGAAVLAQREGVPAGASIAAAVLLQGLALASGIALSAFLAPELLQGMEPAVRLGIILVGALSVLGSFTLAVPEARATLQRILPASVPTLPALSVGVLAVALLVNALVWAATGLAFVWLGQGLIAAPPIPWGVATAVFTLAYIVGLVAVVAPGGVVVRESLVVLLLQGLVGAKVALALAIASRILLTLTELGAAAPFLAGTRATPPNPNASVTR
jgi:uncharacterized membrane protein YbhN (UPF0104 family)